jgi:hypothetical protein
LVLALIPVLVDDGLERQGRCGHLWRGGDEAPTGKPRLGRVEVLAMDGRKKPPAVRVVEGEGLH